VGIPLQMSMMKRCRIGLKSLYPIVYGKSIVPKSKLLRKEFAKGIVVKVVKKIPHRHDSNCYTY